MAICSCILFHFLGAGYLRWRLDYLGISGKISVIKLDIIAYNAYICTVSKRNGDMQTYKMSEFTVTKTDELVVLVTEASELLQQSPIPVKLAVSSKIAEPVVFIKFAEDLDATGEEVVGFRYHNEDPALANPYHQ